MNSIQVLHALAFRTSRYAAQVFSELWLGLYKEGAPETSKRDFIELLAATKDPAQHGRAKEGLQVLGFAHSTAGGQTQHWEEVQGDEPPVFSRLTLPFEADGGRIEIELQSPGKTRLWYLVITRRRGDRVPKNFLEALVSALRGKSAENILLLESGERFVGIDSHLAIQFLLGAHDLE